MEDIRLEHITIEEFKEEVYSYYLAIFPEEERKSIKQIQSACEKGYVKIIKIMHQSQLVGFMTVNRVKENGYIILDYLAILPEYRDKQFGTKAIRKNTNGHLDIAKKYDTSVEEELADCFIYLLSIANMNNVDIFKAFQDKERKNCNRIWK